MPKLSNIHGALIVTVAISLLLLSILSLSLEAHVRIDLTSRWPHHYIDLVSYPPWADGRPVYSKIPLEYTSFPSNLIISAAASGILASTVTGLAWCIGNGRGSEENSLAEDIKPRFWTTAAIAISTACVFISLETVVLSFFINLWASSGGQEMKSGCQYIRDAAGKHSMSCTHQSAVCNLLPEHWPKDSVSWRFLCFEAVSCLQLIFY
ncbi:uncharacterized protein BDR25DRAFT_103166 [Lindgomyces ingoldianus]|uniref:Uncharacterized protein n=1 Tax=Lindgomyces ingoldianus TaxID=673940 RepID=A0ACB6R867_9PLEO|nr:uncharacterized protein BDR25DRAFT_103166 [Lindgomyces ingoldianus]KAF2475503.1 hypothetical protein BDR25DRAFT_103166 [Lindgomyces ingoldianus]